MEPISLASVLEATGARVMHGPRESTFTSISTDSRQPQPGALFIALRGERFDGNGFALDAFARGAAAALVDSGRAPHALALSEMGLSARTVLECGAPGSGDTTQGLLAIAAHYRKQFTIPFVGVAGAAGKTTTKEIAAHLLKSIGPITASEKSFNNSVGVPHTLLRVGRETRAAVVEIGTNSPGEVRMLARVAKPNIAIITIIAEEHLEGLGSIDGVLEEEASILDELPGDGTAVLNADDRYYPQLRKRARGKIITFGIENKADFEARDVVFHVAGASFTIGGKPATVPLLGTHNIYNTLGALAIASAIGVPLETALRAASDLKPPYRRLERKHFGEVEVIDDCYNANPGSVRAAIRALEGLRNNRRRIFVLGKMHELGAESARLHREIGMAVGAAKFDLFITIGGESSALAAGAAAAGHPASKIIQFPTTADAEWNITEIVRPGDLILVKGSRAEGLEKVVDALRAKFEAGLAAQS
ncbi:MAG: UDP-N-acetylmuramoyl-tripeptide--D-alanyl-D-alanine ligase [Planctomycetes bacterium]|nr:UDP-N-acetylmuramoyl-tripeptide--D-alanyl-D-alanine ligase [Planctomycetota bacterium]